LALDFSGTLAASVVEPRLSLLGERPEFGDWFGGFANPAAFGSIWHTVDELEIPWKIRDF